MSMDLGTLFATIDIKDDGFARKIAKAKTDLTELAKAAEAAAKVSLDVKPTGTSDLDKAAESAGKLGKEMESASKKKADITPKGAGEIDKAATSAENLGKELDKAGKKKTDVAPSGGDKIDKAADGASRLADELDKAGASTPDVTPTGTAEVDKATDSARDLGKELDKVDSSTVDVTPTGTGSVTTAAAEAGKLDGNLQKAGTAGKNLTVSTQPAQELDKAEGSAGKLVDKLGEVTLKAGSKAIKWGAITAGTAAVGGFTAALTKGFGRLDSIDQANAKLQGLGHSAQDIEAIMGSAMDAVKGTAYGFGDAASLAAQMVASGIEPGEELTGVLTTVADTAAIAGRDINDMGLIFGSVAAKGKLQGDDLLQLMSGGIPVLQMLSDELGKTTEEVSEMASKGEIDFATFESAMKNSLGGAAQDAGNTFKGSMDNAGAALGRLGAAILEPAFDAAPGIIGGITDKIDGMTEAAGPLVEEWAGKLGPALSDFAQNIGPQVAAAFGTIKDTAGAVWPVMEKVGSVLTSIPMEAYVAMAGMAIAKHKGLTGALSSGTGVLKGWGSEVAATQRGLQSQGREIGVVSAAMVTLGQRVPVVGQMGDAYRKAGDGMRIAGMMSRDSAREMTGIHRVGGQLKGTMQTLGGTLSGTVAGGFSLAKSGAKGLLTALGGPWGLVIGGATLAISKLISSHQEARAAEEAHKAMQDSLRGSLEETTGAISDQTRELQLKNLESRHEGSREAAAEMGISEQTLQDALTGDDSARARVSRRTDSYLSDQVAGSDFWATYGSDLEGQGVSQADVADYVAASQRGDSEAVRATGVTDALKAAGHGEGMRTGYGGDLKDLRDDMDDAAEAANNLAEGIGDGNYQLEQQQERLREGAFDDFTIEANRAKDVMGMLSDEIESGKVRMEDPATIAVEMDAAKADKVKGDLDEIGVKSEFKNGELHIEMPEGAGIIAMLDEMGIALEMLPNGTINLDSNTDEEKQKLVDLGLASDVDGKITMNDDFQEKIAGLEELGALSMIDGRLTITDNTGAVVANLDSLGIKATTLPDGQIEITDTSAANMSRLSELGVKTTTLPDGTVVITDNAAEVQSRIKDTLNSPNGDTTSNHTTFWSDRYTSTSGTAVGQHYAQGGRLPENAEGDRLPRNAGGVRHGGYRLPTTGPGTNVTDGILGVDGNGQPSSWVDAGEWIVNGDRSEKMDDTLAAINSGTPAQMVAALMSDLDAFADGGRVAATVKSQTASMDGTPYIFGGWSPAGTDCSGAVSIGVNTALGRPMFESRTATGSMGGWLAERGFQPGKGGPGDIRVGWYNGGPGGGHTAMQLGDGTFIESGGNTGGGYTIGKTAGPLEGRGFTDWMFLPSDGGNPDMPGIDSDSSGSYSSYTSTAGSSSSSSGGGSVGKTVNGGAGPLLKDGSVLEAAAAAYSKATGTPMADDVVSWGNVLGLGTTFEGENLEVEQRRHEREMRSHERNIGSTERDLAQAKKDVAEKEKALAEAKGEDREQAQWELDDARDKVADLTDQLADMKDETAELAKTNRELTVAIRRQKNTPQYGVTAMADGGFTGTTGVLGNVRNAQINEGSATLWAEAGPEAYIPLSRNKRARSLDIWAETGKRLGVDVLSLLNLVGSGLPGLMDGKLQFSSGNTVSLDAMGLNTEAAAVAGGREVARAADRPVGAVFNGPVQINDPRQYLQGQLNNASKAINKGMMSRMLR